MNTRRTAAGRKRRARQHGTAAARPLALLFLLLAPSVRAGDAITLRCGTNTVFAVEFDRASQDLRIVANGGRTLAESRLSAGPPRREAGPGRAERFHDSPRFTFAENSGVAMTSSRRQVVAVKDAGLFIVLDRSETGLRDARWHFPAARFDVDEAGQRIATDDGLTLRHFGPRVACRQDGATDLLVAARETGATALITLIGPESAPAAERIETADSIGFSLSDTNGLLVVCALASGGAPVPVRQLDVRAGFVLMAGRPNEPLHGLLLGAEIRPPGSGGAAAWSSVWSSQTGADSGSATVTLPRDCEFCVSEAFEVVAPLRPRAAPRD